jgi:hypothetical protein
MGFPGVSGERGRGKVVQNVTRGHFICWASFRLSLEPDMRRDVRILLVGDGKHTFDMANAIGYTSNLLYQTVLGKALSLHPSLRNHLYLM